MSHHSKILFPSRYMAQFTAAPEPKAPAKTSGKGKATVTTPQPATTTTSGVKRTAAQNDKIREGVVVFMGTIARHLGADNPKIVSVVNSLVEVGWRNVVHN